MNSFSKLSHLKKSLSVVISIAAWGTILHQLKKIHPNIKTYKNSLLTKWKKSISFFSFKMVPHAALGMTPETHIFQKPHVLPPLLFLFSLLIHKNSYCWEIEPHSEERLLTSPSQNLVTYVGPQKFKLIGQTGLRATYVITNPGTYILTEDILSQVTTGQVVSITCSNVIFDLGGKSLTLTTGSPAAIDGFTIPSRLSNIVIRNGTINTMTGNGVLVGASCTNVRLEDLTITGCATSGASFIGSSGSSLVGCSMENCTIQLCKNNTTTASGLKLTFCNYFTAQNCNFFEQQATGPAQNCYGVYASNSKNATFLQCDSQGNSGTAVAAGFYADTGCFCFLFKECTAKLNSSSATTTTGKAYGFFETEATNNRFENCLSANTTAYALSVGFYSQNSSFSYYLKCTSQNNSISGTSGTTGGYGFLVETATCKGTVFDTCVAFGNKGSNDSVSRGCGFSIDNSLGCTIKDCTSQANDGTSGLGIGIAIEPGTVRCCIQNNMVIANTSKTLGKAYGILDESSPSTSLITGNVAFGNRDESATPTNQNYKVTYTSGTAIQSTAKNSLKTLNIPTFANTDITP